MNVRSILDNLTQPCVTPLGPAGPLLEFEPDLLAAAHTKPGVRYYSIHDYHELYRSGKSTPQSVIEALLPLTKPGGAKQSQYENAWADNHGNDKLVLEAAKASTQRWAAGRPLSILDGVPIGVKDDVSVEGYVSHNGMKFNAESPFFKKQEESVWCVKALQDAGAIVLGKNRMHELGSGEYAFIPDAQGDPPSLTRLLRHKWPQCTLQAPKKKRSLHSP